MIYRNPTTDAVVAILGYNISILLNSKIFLACSHVSSQVLDKVDNLILISLSICVMLTLVDYHAWIILLLHTNLVALLHIHWSYFPFTFPLIPLYVLMIPLSEVFSMFSRISSSFVSP